MTTSTENKICECGMNKEEHYSPWKVDSPCKKFKPQTDQFCLSDKIEQPYDYEQDYETEMIKTEDVKEFVRLIQSKVLMYWKGQNEFIDWLNKKAGEKLSE